MGIIVEEELKKELLLTCISLVLLQKIFLQDFETPIFAPSTLS